jgi:hypothetical protein
MIRYALVCAKGHSFESWFQNSSAYDKQVKRKLVTCPTCGSAEIRKEIMSPRLAGARKRNESSSVPGDKIPSDKTQVAMVSPGEIEFRKKLKELRDHLTKNADYVGAKFPEEARRMHYGEIDQRSIYGEASLDEAKKLQEEGIEFHPLPVLPDERN